MGTIVTMQTKCPNCRTLLEIAEEFSGRTIQCGRCQELFRARSVEDEAEQRYRVLRPNRDEDDDDDRRPSRSRSSATDSGVAVGSLVLAIITLFMFCLWPIGLATGSIGVVLSLSSLRSRQRPVAVAGLVLSCVGLIFSAGFAVLTIAGIIQSADREGLGPTRNNPSFKSR
jgi:predicted Zn finger-like uncharacterized protein